MKDIIKTCGCGLTFREPKEAQGHCPACVMGAPGRNAAAEMLREAGIAFEAFVKRKTGLDFYNVSSLDMGKLMGDQDNIRA